MNLEERMEIILGNTPEVVSRDALKELLSKDGEKRAYVGFEPSGKVHIGWLILADKIDHLTRCGFHVIIYLADWHAYINDKLGGDIATIRKCGAYMEDCFLALGIDEERTSFVYASELLDNLSYWEKVFQVAKKSTLARIKRAMTIMGRTGDEAEMDSSKFYYPAMQVADIFHLDVDLALGGLDQRRAHMLALDVADKLKWKKPVVLHTPILSGLDSRGRMDMADAKMSKSDPSSCIFIHDDLPAIREKLKKAYCPQGEIEGNPVIELIRFIVFPRLGEFTIKRPDKWGGDMHFADFDALRRGFENGDIHPLDLKMAAAEALGEILKSVHERTIEKYGSLKAVEEMSFV